MQEDLNKSTANTMYEEDDKAAPVVNDITIRIAMCLMVMAAWART
jgi:hypothetical protein